MASGQWWVVTQGATGDFISDLIKDVQAGGTGLSGIGSTVTVKQSVSKPSNAVEGPYNTKAEAQAEANSINTTGTQATAVGGSWQTNLATILQDLGSGSFWLRIGEFAVGGLLFAAGLYGLFKPQVQQAHSGYKKAKSLLAK